MRAPHYKKNISIKKTIQAAKIIGTSMATIGLIAGLGNIVLISVIASISLLLLVIVLLMPIPGVRCPTCAARGIES